MERLGFDHLLAYDHVLGAVHADRERPLPGPYTERDPFHDPLVMFAYLAGITERIGFASGVMVLPSASARVARLRVPASPARTAKCTTRLGIGPRPDDSIDDLVRSASLAHDAVHPYGK